MLFKKSTTFSKLLMIQALKSCDTMEQYVNSNWKSDAEVLEFKCEEVWGVIGSIFPLS